MNAYLEAFQCIELTSGEDAAPQSPIPPALESGPMDKNGTDVVMVFSLTSCPVSVVAVCALICVAIDSMANKTMENLTCFFIKKSIKECKFIN